MENEDQMTEEPAEEMVEQPTEENAEQSVEQPVEENAEKPTQRKMGKDDNTVFIGKKGVMSYVLAVVTQFNNGMNEVIIKARGKAISRAVDVAEIVKQRFITEAEVVDIKIATEEIQGDEGIIKVSAIEITLSKG